MTHDGGHEVVTDPDELDALMRAAREVGGELYAQRAEELLADLARTDDPESGEE